MAQAMMILFDVKNAERLRIENLVTLFLGDESCVHLLVFYWHCLL